MQILCPQCQQPLQHDQQRWFCDNRHSFDIARQGYCNLLTVQHKRSRQPGDDAEMVAARSHFLDAGYYQALADAIKQQCQDIIKQQSLSSITVCDAGCGEGYYSAQLFELLQAQLPCQLTGIDISKFAVRAAARRNKHCQWFVASSSRLPFTDHSCDIILSLFSPLPATEFLRCLKPEGHLLIAATGQQHLIELRQQLYDRVKEDAYDPGKDLGDCFQLDRSTTIEQTITLKQSQQILDLLAMTPHYWRSTPEKKQQLSLLENIALTVDIQLQCYSPINISPISTDKSESSC
ncbi:MAG: methyltransferase domain-containing protein [Halieaceae bacterium]|nr:methyltransferase domain-containing protein [Halieaceae bacterium]